MIALIADWPAVIAHLTEESTEPGEGGSTAAGLLKVMSTARFLALLHFFADLLGVLSRLSKQFQSDDVFIGDVPGMILSTRKKVEKLHRSPVMDGYQQKFLREFSEDDGKFDRQSVSMKHASRIDADRSTLIEATLHHLDSRFTSIRENVLAKA